MSPTKLLVLSGSPIVGGSTELLLHAAAEGYSNATLPAFPDWNLDSKGFYSQAANSLTDSAKSVLIQFARLNEMQILPCQSCGKAPTPEFCFYHDDLDPVLTALAECNALLIGSPIHFDAVSAQAKLLIDRSNCFRPPDFDGTLEGKYRFIKLLKQKRPGGMILVGGPDAWYEGARRCIAGFFKWVEVTNEGMVTYQSEDYHQKGSAALDETSKLEANELGNRIAHKTKSP